MQIETPFRKVSLKIRCPVKQNRLNESFSSIPGNISPRGRGDVRALLSFDLSFQQVSLRDRAKKISTLLIAFITFQKGVSKRRTLAVFYLEKPERKDPPCTRGWPRGWRGQERTGRGGKVGLASGRVSEEGEERQMVGVDPDVGSSEFSKFPQPECTCPPHSVTPSCSPGPI